jgi:8-oxo-dGTP diphosphatase
MLSNMGNSMKVYSKVTRHLNAVDCIIFGYDILEKAIKLLLIKRSFKPSKDKWSLSGGFVDKKESLDNAAKKILFDLTGLKNVFMNQSYTYGDVKRDPGDRVISTAYFALIKIQDLDNKKKKLNGAEWKLISNIPALIFDHQKMVSDALNELRNQIKAKPVGFELLPEKFTLVQLQDLYEAIYQRQIDRRNFRRKILSMDLLQRLDEKEKETSRRGAYYYKFIPERYKKFSKKGSSFNLDVS